MNNNDKATPKKIDGSRIVTASITQYRMSDEKRKEMAKYLVDYVIAEVRRLMLNEDFRWNIHDVYAWIESGLEAYETTHEG